MLLLLRLVKHSRSNLIYPLEGTHSPAGVSQPARAASFTVPFCTDAQQSAERTH